MKLLGKYAWLIAVAAVFTAAILVSLLSNAFTQPHAVSYTVTSALLCGKLRLALINDLHGCRYGRDNSGIFALLEAASPDAVLLCGDIFDSDSNFQVSKAFLERISTLYPCYFVMGNHEYGTHHDEEITALVRSLGITLLEGDCAELEAGGMRIRIAGADDVFHDQVAYAEQLDALTEDIEASPMYTVLLSHEPQFVDQLLSTGADLIVSGHTHGGQWSIPGLLNGLYAPGQGLFPKYAGGRYVFGAQTLIVSRGLSKEPLLVPRIFTPRELVLLDLVGID